MATNDNPLDILIIGGSGFVSGTMARAALSQGHEVSTLTRGQRPVPTGVHSLVADRHDEASFEQAVQHAGHQGGHQGRKQWDLVIDCIGFEAADARQDLAVFRERTPHLVFISTDFVFDPAHRRFPQPEETEYYSDTGYGGQKRRCELEFINGDAGDMQWTILRSCHIYGPGSLLGCLPTHGRDPQLLEKMKAGEALKLVGGGHFLQQPILAEDLADVALSCHGNAATYGEIFCCAGPEIIESRAFYQIIADIIDVELTKIEELPVAAFLADDPESAPFLCHRIYDLGKLKAAGLAVPSTPVAEGLRAHVESILTE